MIVLYLSQSRLFTNISSVSLHMVKRFFRTVKFEAFISSKGAFTHLWLNVSLSYCLLHDIILLTWYSLCLFLNLIRMTYFSFIHIYIK